VDESGQEGASGDEQIAGSIFLFDIQWNPFARHRPDLPEYAAAGRAALGRGEYEPTVAAFHAMYDRWEDEGG
jgi:hypothetical protein